MWRALRLRFWRWAHDRAEALWHWIYYKKLGPLTPKPQLIAPNRLFLADHREATDEEKKRGIKYVHTYRSLL
jgi:hypothetical protein